MLVSNRTSDNQLPTDKKMEMNMRGKEKAVEIGI